LEITKNIRENTKKYFSIARWQDATKKIPPTGNITEMLQKHQETGKYRGVFNRFRPILISFQPTP
jgi:hypothetical protein